MPRRPLEHENNAAASSDDEDESTLRAMSALGQQERAHPAARRLATSKARRPSDWSRVLALAELLARGAASPPACAAELSALARRRLRAVDASNQTEEDGGAEDESESESGEEEAEAEAEEEEESAADEPQAAQPMGRQLKPPRSLSLSLSLSLAVAEPVRKSVREPKPPRAGSGSGSGSHASACSQRSSEPTPSPRPQPAFAFADVDAASPRERRRVTIAGFTGAVALRRQSFSMKKRKPLAERRKSVSACVASSPQTAAAARTSRRRASVSATTRRASALLAMSSPGKALATAKAPALPSPPSPPLPLPVASSQLVLRVRERRRDGVRELVLRKRTRTPAVVWHWHDRQRGVQAVLDECARVVRLGPQQHGVMLRQLRFVKAAMHELPWAKSHLRALLARYTAQRLSKEELYPQLALLSTQVEAEAAARAARAKDVAVRKQRLTVQLTLATGVVSDVRATKFGRRGRPHATRLCYDPSEPLRLRWVRKGGDRSDEFLAVDDLEVLEQRRALARDGARFDLRRVPKRPDAADTTDAGVDSSCLLSLVSAASGRALDLCVASPLHREWLATALREISAFARQYRAASASPSPSSGGNRRLADSV